MRRLSAGTMPSIFFFFSDSHASSIRVAQEEVIACFYLTILLCNNQDAGYFTCFLYLIFAITHQDEKYYPHFINQVKCDSELLNKFPCIAQQMRD